LFVVAFTHKWKIPSKCPASSFQIKFDEVKEEKRRKGNIVIKKIE
jgi:hypothetical protein